MVPGVPCEDGGNWGWERDITIGKQHNLHNALCFVKTVCENWCLIPSFHIQTHTPFVVGHTKWCRAFSEWAGPRILSTAWKLAKWAICYCELKLRKYCQKCDDLTTNYDAETNISLAEKIKNVSEGSEHNFEGGGNSELDKRIRRKQLE